MSTTTTINPINPDKSNKAAKVSATVIGATVASAGVGVAGAHIVSELLNSDDVAPEENVVAEETADTAEQAAETSGNTAAASTHPAGNQAAATTANNTTATTATTAATGPEPITGSDITDTPADTPAEQVQVNVTTEEELQVTPDETVNPDEIAQAIISEEIIDPNDIDMVDIVNFEEIGTVYTVDGEVYTAATFHDPSGQGFVMVDVDGDNVFDLITDPEGNVVDVAYGNLSVGDAQEDIEDDGGYLAYDEDYDNVDEYGADTLAEDLMA